MIINNPNALRVWLTRVLQPICVADPAALARYVFALLKKDKPVKELKKIMIEQLNVFLGDETKPFLERLFTAIATEEYLIQSKHDETTASTTSSPSLPISLTTTSVTTSETLQSSSALSDSEQGTTNSSYVKKSKECTPPLSDNTKEIGANKIIDNCNTPPPSSSISGQNQTSTSTTNNVVIAPIVNANQSVSPSKTTSDKENQPRDSRKRRASLRSRSRTRSRSRSVERIIRRSRSPRDRRISDREKSSRQFRNKSPPPSSSDRDIRSRRSDRRPSDRSPRNFGKNRTKSHSASRSRSVSPERRKISRSTSPTANENGCPPAKRQRCRDFDEKGYCVRGETCPWDHGVNPVVLEGLNNPALITMPPHLREYNPDAPELWNRGGNYVGPRTAPFPHKQAVGAAVPGVYPRPPGVGGFRPGVSPFPFPVNPTATTPLPRELIPVPVIDANAGAEVPQSIPQPKRRFETDDTVAIPEAPTKRKLPINSRLGPRVGPQQNCSLELRKIPRGMNTIAHLNNHFSKFGKIVNIQISYEGDPEAAIVTFSTHAEANVAYRSTEAVLNNRFIKVFWHSAGNSGAGNVDSQSITNSSTIVPKEDVVANGRKLSQYHLNNIVPTVPTSAATTDGTKSLTVSAVQTTTSTVPSTTAASITSNISSNSTTTTTTNSTTTVAAAHIAAPTMRKNNRLPTVTTAIIRKKQEEQVKAAVQLAHGLHKRKHELLQEYLKQMKQAVELVERVDHTDPQKSKLLDTVKGLQGIIEKLKKEIAQEQAQISAQIQNQPPAKKSKEQQKKELLDIELELIAQQQEGNDTTAIQKRIEELQRSLGSVSHKPNFGGRPSRLRTAPPGSTSVDRRPKTILITGFASEDSDLILGHFKHFGEITKNEIDCAIPSLKISYATRANAEQAVLRGRLFKDKRLQISWVTPTSLQNASHLLKFQLKDKKFDKNLIKNDSKTSSNGTTTTNGEKIDDKIEINDTSLTDENDITTITGTTTDEKIPSTLSLHDLSSDNHHLLPELRLEDEEEEEDAESEDRSWRR